MANRKNPRAALVARQATDLAVAAPQVVAHRLTRMAMAGANPSARDRREFTRMVSEKQTAFQQSWAAMGMQSIFARFPVQFRVRRPSWFGWGPVRERTQQMALCVREYFPDNFRASYRQKARWVLGIGLQSWESLGWRGSLATKYLLARDRKGIITSFVSIIAYIIFLQLLLFWLLKMTGVWTMQFPSVFQAGTWQMNVALLTTAALATRVVQRFYFVNRLYGWEHALMSIPRMVVGNMINFMATARAWKVFLAYLLFGKRMVWDKTMHDFPDAAQLVQTRKQLGELLTTWQAVEPERLQQALRQVSLAHLADKLDVNQDWSRILSIGEQQRLAFARVLFNRPAIVFLDESTSAMDEGLEHALYTLLREQMRSTMLVSVGHRSTLAGFHTHALAVDGNGGWTLSEGSAPQSAPRA